MALGRSTRAPADHVRVDAADDRRPVRSSARSWRTLSAACRLAAVERAIRVANDAGDGLPFAL